MMVEGRGTHIDLRGEVIDTQRPGEVTLQPIDGPGDLMTLTSRCKGLGCRKNILN